MATTNASVRKQMNEIAENESRNTHFTKHECQELLSMYNKFTCTKEGRMQKMDRTIFRDILHNHFSVTDDVLMDRVFRAFDADNDGNISKEEWIRGLSVYLRGSKQEKATMCHIIYDLNGDGYISREEMFQLLKKCVQKSNSEEDPDESVKDLVEIVIKLMDMDRDNRFSLTDYLEAVEREPLLIESFGPVLPTSKMTETFECLIRSEN